MVHMWLETGLCWSSLVCIPDLFVLDVFFYVPYTLIHCVFVSCFYIFCGLFFATSRIPLSCSLTLAHVCYYAEGALPEPSSLPSFLIWLLPVDWVPWVGGRGYISSTSFPCNNWGMAIRSLVFHLSLPFYFLRSAGCHCRCEGTFRLAASSSSELHGCSGRVGNVEI